MVKSAWESCREYLVWEGKRIKIWHVFTLKKEGLLIIGLIRQNSQKLWSAPMHSITGARSYQSYLCWNINTIGIDTLFLRSTNRPMHHRWVMCWNVFTQSSHLLLPFISPLTHFNLLTRASYFLLISYVFPQRLSILSCGSSKHEMKNYQRSLK